MKKDSQLQLNIGTQISWSEAVAEALNAMIEHYNERLAKCDLQLEVTWPALHMQTGYYVISLIAHQRGGAYYTHGNVRNVTFGETIAPSEVVKKAKTAIAKLLLVGASKQ